MTRGGTADARRGGIRRFARTFAAVAVLVLSMFCLVACGAPADEGGAEYSASVMRLYGWRTGEDGSVYALFTTAQTETVYAEAACETVSYAVSDGAFYRVSGYGVRFDAASAAETALACAPAETGASYENLKIVFVYATMNESIASDGERSESDGVYLHTVTASPTDGEVTFEATLRSPVSGAWYAVLAASAVAALAVCVAVVLIVRRRKWRKKTM